jgi:hypothetical protein
VYETKGAYVVQVETVWTGTYSWTATDGTSGEGELGSVTRTSRHDYKVDEVRSVLTG